MNDTMPIEKFPGVPLKDLADRYGTPNPLIDTSDPAFQPPTDPALKATKQSAGIVYRDLPLITIQNTWSVDQVRSALYAHTTGFFDSSSQLFDAIIGDARVRATLESRITGLFGREVRFKPGNDSSAAKECRDAWVKCWPQLSGGAGMKILSRWGIGMGFGPSQLVWNTTKPIWEPLLRPWEPRFTYYHWPSRQLRAMSQDGEIAIDPGNGKWVLHAPYGEYRGWMYGAIRAVAEPWMLRHFAFRDMARFSEIHGLPTRVGYVPSVSDPEERAQFESSLAQLGSDTSMILPKGVDGQNGDGYDYKLVEATDTAWESFPGLQDRCDMDIILALLFQNLTTEVKGGSFAATSAHMDIRQGGIQDDNEAWKNTIYNQIARQFAWLNYGDADLAPWTWWDVEPRDNLEGNARQFQQFGTAIEVLARGGVKFNDVEELRAFASRYFGLNDLPDFTISTPAAPSAGGGFGA